MDISKARQLVPELKSNSDKEVQIIIDTAKKLAIIAYEKMFENKSELICPKKTYSE